MMKKPAMCGSLILSKYEVMCADKQGPCCVMFTCVFHSYPITFSFFQFVVKVHTLFNVIDP